MKSWYENRGDLLLTRNCCGYFNNKTVLTLRTDVFPKNFKGKRITTSSYLQDLFRKFNILKCK